MENVEVKMLSAEQARLIAEPKEKLLKDIMHDIEFWAKKGHNLTPINTLQHYITEETRNKLIELGYTVGTPTPNYYYIDISWKKP